MDKVDKGCSEFCVIVGTVTRTASILIHSRLKVLAVKLSRPSGRLWLYAGLTRFNNPCWLKADLAVDENPSSSSSWVSFFWYRPTWVVLDKWSLNSCVVAVCVCLTVHMSYHTLDQGSQTHLSMWAAVEDNSHTAGRTTKCNCFTQHCSQCS